MANARNREMSFMEGSDLNKRISKHEINDDKIRAEIPDGAEIHVELGENFDFSTIKIDEDIPKTRKFRVYKYKNPRT